MSVQYLSLIGAVLVDEQARVCLCGFVQAFDRLAKGKCIRFQRKIFDLHLRGFLLVVVVLLVAQVRDQLSQAMRNSDPRVRMVFVTDSILISTPYLPCRQQVVTSNAGPILVFPLFQPSGSDVFSSLGKVYSRQATASVNCENSSVSFVMKYCPTSTVVRNPA